MLKEYDQQLLVMFFRDQSWLNPAHSVGWCVEGAEVSPGWWAMWGQRGAAKSQIELMAQPGHLGTLGPTQLYALIASLGVLEGQPVGRDQCGLGSVGSVWGGVTGISVGWGQWGQCGVGSVLSGISGVSFGWDQWGQCGVGWWCPCGAALTAPQNLVWISWDGSQMGLDRKSSFQMGLWKRVHSKSGVFFEIRNQGLCNRFWILWANSLY